MAAPDEDQFTNPASPPLRDDELRAPVLPTKQPPQPLAPPDVTDRASEAEPIGGAVTTVAPPPATPLREGYIDSRFKVHHQEAIPEFSTEFAKACRVSGKRKVEELDVGEIYGLIFHPKYPAPVHLIRALRQLESALFPSIVDEGKIEVAGVARYMVILEKPKGVRLSTYVKESGPLSEPVLAEVIVPQLSEALELLHAEGYTHGAINADNVYYDAEAGQIQLREFFSNYNGYTQKIGHETMNRLLCHPVAKGNGNASADYYAMGVFLVQLLTAHEPLSGFSRQEVVDHRLRNGSYDITIFELIQQKVKLSGRFQQLIRALLRDVDAERWGEQQVTEWLSKKVSTAVAAAKPPKETTNPFNFLSEKYHSRKHLAHAIAANWVKSKTSLKPGEIARWLRLSLKQTSAAERIETMFSTHIASNTNLVIPDDKLARLLIILDPTGPIRFKQHSVHLNGVGAYLCYGFYKSDREMIQGMADILNDRLIEYYLEAQEEAGSPERVGLNWSPYKEYQYIRKTALGFGIERCLYDLNPTLPCQSALLVDDYVMDLTALMNTLNEKAASKKPDSDPMDRHIAAFVANRIDLLDEIRIKSLQRFPTLVKNPQLNMLALLTVAQAHGRIKALKGLSGWMSVRLSNFIEGFHSDGLRRELRNKLDKSAREGNLNAMFRVLTDPTIPTRDNNGYADAIAQYKYLAQEIHNLERGGVVERLGYHYGLRFAMLLSYVVLAGTTILALARLS